MTTCDCFKSGAVRRLVSKAKFDAIRELIRKSPAFRKVENLEKLEEAVVQREQIQSTACGHGIAFAHAKTDQVSNIVVVLGVSRTGIDFGTPDGNPVNLLFIIASPLDTPLEYLMTLSALARIFYDGCFTKEDLKSLTLPGIGAKLIAQLKNAFDVARLEVCQ